MQQDNPYPLGGVSGVLLLLAGGVFPGAEDAALPFAVAFAVAFTVAFAVVVAVVVAEAAVPVAVVVAAALPQLVRQVVPPSGTARSSCSGLPSSASWKRR